MRVPEMPLEPAERDGSFGFAQDDRPEDEDRVHALVAWANERTRGTDCHGPAGLAMTDTKGGAA